MLAVDDVVEVAAFVVPEARVERFARARRRLVDLRRHRVAFLAQPVGKQHQRVVPERIDLDGLASPRRHDPAIHLRVHPRQLDAFLALPQQAVGCIDADAEPRPLHMMLDDRFQLRQQVTQRRAIAGGEQVAVDGVEEPEGRVRRVVQAFLRPFGEHVRDQAIADVVPERAKDVSRFALAAGAERQPFEADHGVAPPISEPMVSRDDDADFIAGGVRTRRFLEAASRRNDELVGCETQFSR